MGHHMSDNTIQYNGTLTRRHVEEGERDDADECPSEERPERHIEHCAWGPISDHSSIACTPTPAAEVDEPVGNQWRGPDDHHKLQQVVAIPRNLQQHGVLGSISAMLTLTSSRSAASLCGKYVSTSPLRKTCASMYAHTPPIATLCGDRNRTH